MSALSLSWASIIAIVALLLELIPSQSIAIGETICAEGFIMDDYCLYINLDSQGRGRLLDTNDITLAQPERHTLHCLVDIGVCNAGPFFLLKDPSVPGVGSLYTVQYELNDHTELLTLARSTGRQGGGCRTCLGGENGLVSGLRAEVVGVVTHLGTAAGAPPRIDMTSARVSNGLSTVCEDFQDTGIDDADTGSFWASFLVLLQLLVRILVGGGQGR